MSIERYYAICHPFRSRESRQTKKHAYRILAMVWTLAFITMSPTAIVSKLQQTNQTGNYYYRIYCKQTDKQKNELLIANTVYK